MFQSVPFNISYDSVQSIVAFHLPRKTVCPDVGIALLRSSRNEERTRFNVRVCSHRPLATDTRVLSIRRKRCFSLEYMIIIIIISFNPLVDISSSVALGNEIDEDLDFVEYKFYRFCFYNFIQHNRTRKIMFRVYLKSRK